MRKAFTLSQVEGLMLSMARSRVAALRADAAQLEQQSLSALVSSLISRGEIQSEQSLHVALVSLAGDPPTQATIELVSEPKPSTPEKAAPAPVAKETRISEPVKSPSKRPHKRP